MRIVLYEKKIQNMTSYIFMIIGLILILSAIIYQCGAAQFLAGGVGLWLIIGSLFHQMVGQSKSRTIIEVLCVISLAMWAIVNFILWS